MSRTLKKSKWRRDGDSFLMLRHDVINNENFRTLTARATKLLIDMASQYRGNNNGDLAATWSLLRKRGWNSKDQIAKGLAELLRRGWIVQCKQGMRTPPVPTLYALTWLAIDECGGKLDRSSTKAPLNYWRAGSNPEYQPSPTKDGHVPFPDPRHAGRSAPPHGATIDDDGYESDRHAGRIRAVS
jgi:hypothetical protein